MSMIKTPISILQEFLQKNNKIPEYHLLSTDGLGTHRPMFGFRVNAGEVIGFGKARTKKEAKHEAARDALEKFANLGLYVPDQSETPPLQASPVFLEPELSISQINAVSMLQDFVVDHNLPPVEYMEISCLGPAHHRLFTMECTVGNWKITASEYTKKKAKRACAQLMYQHLFDIMSGVGLEETVYMNYEEVSQNGDGLEEYSNSSINIDENKPSYELNNSEFPSTFNKIMKEKNLSFEDLWQGVDSANEDNLEKVLNKLDLKFAIDSLRNENNFIFLLSIKSEPVFSFVKIASTFDDVPHLVAEVFEFLKIMTSQ